MQSVGDGKKQVKAWLKGASFSSLPQVIIYEVAREGKSGRQEKVTDFGTA